MANHNFLKRDSLSTYLKVDKYAVFREPCTFCGGLGVVHALCCLNATQGDDTEFHHPDPCDRCGARGTLSPATEEDCAVVPPEAKKRGFELFSQAKWHMTPDVLEKEWTTSNEGVKDNWYMLAVKEEIQRIGEQIPQAILSPSAETERFRRRHSSFTTSSTQFTKSLSLADNFRKRDSLLAYWGVDKYAVFRPACSYCGGLGFAHGLCCLQGEGHKFDHAPDACDKCGARGTTSPESPVDKLVVPDAAKKAGFELFKKEKGYIDDPTTGESEWDGTHENVRGYWYEVATLREVEKLGTGTLDGSEEGSSRRLSNAGDVSGKQGRTRKLSSGPSSSNFDPYSDMKYLIMKRDSLAAYWKMDKLAVFRAPCGFCKGAGVAHGLCCLNSGGHDQEHSPDSCDKCGNRGTESPQDDAALAVVPESCKEAAFEIFKRERPQFSAEVASLEWARTSEKVRDYWYELAAQHKIQDIAKNFK